MKIREGIAAGIAPNVGAIGIYTLAGSSYPRVMQDEYDLSKLKSRKNPYRERSRRTGAPAIPTLQNIIVYLFGFAGTGKYSIAEALARRTDVRIVDNQLINEPIFRVLLTDGKSPLPPAVWDQVRRVREVVFDTIRTLSPPGLSFVLTNELLANDPKSTALFAQVEAVATARGSLFVPVRLLCDVDELCRRVAMPERLARGKSIDPEGARRQAERHIVFIPNHPHTLTLDVSQVSAERSAMIIHEYIQALYPTPTLPPPCSGPGLGE